MDTQEGIVELGGGTGTGTGALDINGLTTAVSAADDTLPIYDTSAAGNRKSTIRSVLYERMKDRTRLGFNFFTDFIQETSATATDNGLAETSSGAGAASTLTGTDTANRPGLVSMSTGSTSTGRTALCSGVNQIRLSGGEWYYETALNVTTLSDGTERYQLVVGFLDTLTAADQVDAVAFVYDEGGVSTGSTASANWQTVTVSNSTRTWNTGGGSGVAISAGAWVRLGILVNADATSVGFYIDGALVATHTANIPTASSRTVGFGALLIKSLGTTARTITVDYVNVAADFTTAR